LLAGWLAGWLASERASGEIELWTKARIRRDSTQLNLHLSLNGKATKPTASQWKTGDFLHERI